MKGEEAATTSPTQKVPSVSPPLACKSSAFDEDFCDPKSASDKPRALSLLIKLAQIAHLSGLKF